MYKIDRDKIKIIQADLLEFNVSAYHIDIKLIDWNNKEPNEYDDEGKLYKICFTDEEGLLEKDAVAALTFNLFCVHDSANTYLVLYDGNPVAIIMSYGYIYDKEPLFVDWNDIGRAVSYFLMGSEQLSVDGKELNLWR